MHEQIQQIYQAESRRVLATLIRQLGDFELAEEALHDAFTAALEQWPRDGIPAQPRAWLVSTGRFKAIDQLRRRSRFGSASDIDAEDVAEFLEQIATDEQDDSEASIADGPFAETKEQLAGFYLLEANDLNHAIQLAGKIPGPYWLCGDSPDT